MPQPILPLQRKLNNNCKNVLHTLLWMTLKNNKAGTFEQWTPCRAPKTLRLVNWVLRCLDFHIHHIRVPLQLQCPPRSNSSASGGACWSTRHTF
jgi:hypothetical protein